jgi:glycosyltransferase involved in cell wall biosynthesis
MRVLSWHVHGAWSTSFVQGDHDYLVPVVPDRGPDGLGRARTYRWPDTVTEVTPQRLAAEPVDVVVLQRPRDLELADAWLGGRRPGRDLPAVYVEHDCPRGGVPHTRHPLADRDDVTLVHVTHFNDLMWDSGRAPTTVIEHGVVDPGPLWTGELPRAGVVVNMPVRRGRLVGTDLLPRFAAAAPLDVFGMEVGKLAGQPALSGLADGRLRTYDDLAQPEMHRALACRRVYVHPFRWTSLGLSLVEAMQLGMPVVALASTEAVEAVPPEAGACSTRMEVLTAAVRHYLADPDAAAEAGRAARAAALARYGLGRYLDDWDRLLKEVTR